jgi:tetratricopeptide (TPR) repeat protein
VLTCAAAASTAFGLMKMKEAQQTRELADQSRTEAEKLLTYLMVDFYTELEQVGQVPLLREFTERTAKYYRSLPAAMRTPATEANRAMALMQLSKVLRTAGEHEGKPLALLDEAIAIISLQEANGNTAEASQLILSQALLLRARLAISNRDPALGAKLFDRATTTARPFAEKERPTDAARLAYARALYLSGYFKIRNINSKAGIPELKHGMEVADIGVRLADNMPLALTYVTAAAFLHESYVRTEQHDAASAIAKAFDKVTREALLKHPGNSGLLDVRTHIPMERARYAMEIGDMRESMRQATEGLRILDAILIKDPDNRSIIDYKVILLGWVGNIHARRGDYEEAERSLKQIFGNYDHLAPSEYQKINLHDYCIAVAMMYAELGMMDKVGAIQARMRGLAALRHAAPQDSIPNISTLYSDVMDASFQWRAGKLDKASLVIDTLQRRRNALANTVAATGAGPAKEYFETLTRMLERLQGQVAQQAGDNALAERAFAALLINETNIVPTAQKVAQVGLAQALVRLGRAAEARAPLQRTVTALRADIAQGRDDYHNRLTLAEGLFVQAQMASAQAPALLKEASDLLARLSADEQRFRSVRIWRARLAEARRAPAKPAK